MNKKRHKEALIALHKELHTSLDKLSACYISTNEKNLSDTSVMELIEWSYQQTKNPSCFSNKE